MVPEEVLHRAIEHLQVVPIISTKMQRIKDTNVLNGNQYCVVETLGNINVIPESAPVVDPVTKKEHMVPVTFKGEEWYCLSCNLKHIGMCPKIKSRIEAEKQQKNKAPKHL